MVSFLILQKGKPGVAESLYHKVIELNPKLWDIFAQYGDFLLRHNRYKDASSIYKKVGNYKELPRNTC